MTRNTARIVFYRGFSLYHHINNPGHWLENSEIWAAPGRQTSVASSNGYVQAPWKRISSKNIYLSEVAGNADLQERVNAWLRKAFPDTPAIKELP